MLLSDGGGGGDPYQIKVNSVTNGGEEQSMGYQEIMQLLHGLKPGDMTNAAASFKKLGDTLDQVTAKLASTGNQLAGSWSGEAASKAMAKFQQLHDQAAQLAAQAHTTSNTMNWMGTEVMPKFQSLPSPSVMSKSESDAAMGAAAGPGGALVGAGLGALGIGPNGTAKADSAAREYLKSFNQAMTQANDQLPASTSGPGSQANRSESNQWTTPGSSGSGGPGAASGYAGVGGTNGTGGAAPSGYTPPAGASGQVNLSKLSHGSNSPGASLQGYNPGGGNTSSPFSGSHSAANQTGSNSFGPVVPPGGDYGSAKGVSGGDDNTPGEDGPGKNGLDGEDAAGDKALGEDGLKAGKALGDDGAPGGEGLGADGGAGTAAADGAAGTGAGGAAGTAGEAAGADAAGAAGAEGGGMNGMPMGGMGGGDSGKERQRQAWMAEDESIWGVPETDVGSVIG